MQPDRPATGCIGRSPALAMSAIDNAPPAKAHLMPISGFVVAYNRAALLGTCLRSLRFADELIVIDKSSTDDTPRIARRHADRVITVPFSPTVEETRSLALA